jgi:predicted negative regulator of RcsB-dependent stress response
MAEDLLTDDEQWEAIKRWSTENGIWLIAGLALGAAILFGYRYYGAYRTERDLRAATQFNEMTAAIDQNDRAGARRTGAAILQAYAATPYADQAELMLARLFVDDGQLANAVGPLTHVMNDSKDAELRHIARLRLARVLIDQGKPDDAISTLAATPPGAFAARYHEVRGDALYAKKDLSGAAREYQSALGSSDSRSVDVALLELKLADLGATAAPSDQVQKVKP